MMRHRHAYIAMFFFGFLGSCRHQWLVASLAEGQQHFYKDEQAFSSKAFADSIGVATHISYDNTNYVRQFPKMLALLRDAGIRHLRDGLYSTWTADSYPVDHYRQLGEAGIDLTLISDEASTISSIQSFAHTVGNLAALEGMNECDARKCIPTALSQLRMLHEAGSSLGIPVVGLSFTGLEGYAIAGNITPFINYNNIHCYYGGRNPDAIGRGWGGLNIPESEGGAGYAVTKWWIFNNERDAPGVPNIVTETGYLAPSVPRPFQVSEAVQGEYIVRTFLNNFAVGVRRTFVYEFLDEGDVGMRTDPTNEASYGVIRTDMSPKPAYVAIRNLISLTTDERERFTPGKLSFELKGGDSTVRHLLLQRSDGTFILALWSEQSNWNPDQAQPISVGAQLVSLSVLGEHRIFRVHQFTKTGSMTSVAVHGRRADVSTSDLANLIEIK